MSSALDRFFLRERISRFTETSLNSIESRLKEFEADLQATKNEALRNQQMASFIVCFTNNSIFRL